MIVVAALNKPCSTKDRADFIVQYNHQQGLLIEEDNISIKALDYSDKEKAKQQELAQIDQESKELEDTLNELKSAYTQAQMIGDTETMEEISNTTKELLGLIEEPEEEETDNGTEE